MYKEVNTKLNQPELENGVLEFWDKKKVFEKLNKESEGKEAFVFYDGPPGMNGLPHIGHVSNRIYKDIILRYKSMMGYRVLRKAGWDAHGLPVEGQAEKELGFNSKQDIEKFGVEGFIEKCKSLVNYYEKEWVDTTRKIGYWVDMDKPYLTCTNEYIESVWWSLKQLFDRGLIYKGHKVTPYCPRCGTSLSTHEVAQGYKTVTDKTLYVRFKVVGQEDTYFVAWTTTPWTLPSNVALAVNPDTEYSKVKVDKEYYILATKLVDKVFKKYKVVENYLGKELEYMEYEPIFTMDKELLGDKKCYIVTNADYVTTTDGTGVVHIAPAFGVDDSLVGKKYDLPFLQPINDKGCFTEAVAKYEGMRNVDANNRIIDDLTQAGCVVKSELIEHEYPHCWRCKTPLIYYARSSWFVNVSQFRKNLVENNNAVNFLPANVKEGRMGNFVANALDWNLSRTRYWGTPLNIWYCESCGHYHAIGSRQELRELSGIDEDVDLHRPYVDDIEIKCPKCGGVSKRVPEVIDCWYDSGAMPFAQWHYPFENADKFVDQFPADFICEAQDQTRGWFYTLQAISTLLFNKTPYKNCMVAGLVLDAEGCKMSKSTGNVVNPVEVIDKYGADTVRWFFAENSTPWSAKSFDENLLVEGQRKIIGTLWNTYAFYVLYANIDKFDGSVSIEDCELNVMDKWLLSKLNTLLVDIHKYMDEFNFTDTARLIDVFVDELSNWYVRRCRERFWVDGENADKTAAFATLYYVLIELTKIVAPIMPFMAEEIYQNLRNADMPVSVHLCEYPRVDISRINKILEKQMDKVVDIVTLGRVVRADTGIKNRQPLSNMYVYAVEELQLSDDLIQIICDDLNVKNFNIVQDTTKYITLEIKPQLKTLGPKYGRLLGEIRKYFENCKGNELVQKLDAGETEVIRFKDDVVTLTKEDILVVPHSKKNFCAQTDKGITVILDTVLNDELLQEGMMREVISKLQNMRKEAGYMVEDRIVVQYKCKHHIADVIQKYMDTISTTVLSDSITEGEDGEFVREFDINGKHCKFSIRKV